MFSFIFLDILLRDSYPCYNIQPLLPHLLCMYILHGANTAAFDFSSCLCIGRSYGCTAGTS